MKTLIFDMHSGLGHFTDDGFVIRPFFETLIRYAAENKVHIYLAQDRPQKIPESIEEYVTGIFRKKDNPPRLPDLLITSDGDFAKEFSSILIPPYDEHFNEYACLSLGGKLLDLIKERVVLGRQPPDVVKKEPEDEQNSDEKKEDVTHHGFSL